MLRCSRSPPTRSRPPLAKEGLSPADLDLVEINEAFASVGIQSMRDLGLNPDKVNVDGGAISLGHPVGMSGARIALHLAYELQRRGGGIGAAALCGGGGQGDALVLRGRPAERLTRGRSSRWPGVMSRCRISWQRLVRERARGRPADLAGGERVAAVARADAVAGAAVRAMPRSSGSPGRRGWASPRRRRALVSAYRARGRRVGVLAVDPSSPFSGGALLGDRVRMQEHATDPGVFIRSMASRGQLGGLSWATPQALRVLDAAGCDVVLVETVGVGQAEVEIASLADSTVVLLAPGMGDAIQAAKAGILEIADVFIVNKADREGAEQTVRELKGMLAAGILRGDVRGLETAGLQAPSPTGAWTRAAESTTWSTRSSGTGSGSARAGRGTPAVRARPRGDRGNRADPLRSRMDELRGQAALGELSADVAAGRLDPYSAADRLVAGVTT